MAFDKDILVDLEMFSEEQIEKIIEEAGDRAINKMGIEDEIPSPKEMAPFMNEAMREVIDEKKKELQEVINSAVSPKDPKTSEQKPEPKIQADYEPDETEVSEQNPQSPAQKTDATTEVKPKSESDKGRELLDNFISELKGDDLPPEAPSFITRVCGSGFRSLRFRFGQARRARIPQISQASDALVRVFGCRAMSAA